MKKTDIVRLPEREVVKYVLNYFAFDQNIRVWRRNVGAFKKRDAFIRFGEPGQSDICGIIAEIRCPRCGKAVRSGVHLEIECKAYGGRLSPAQIEYQNTVRAHNGIAVTAVPIPTAEDPTGFKSITKILESLPEEMCINCAKR